jgi:hypothetical protein
MQCDFRIAPFACKEENWMCEGHLMKDAKNSGHYHAGKGAENVE